MFDAILFLLNVLETSVYYVAQAVFWTWILWVFYLAVMHLQEARDAGRIPRFAYPVAVVTLIAGYVIDFLVNVIVLSVAMLEIPRETTVTARLKRHRDANDWRGEMSRWIAAQLLDSFDPSGRHI